MSISSRVMKTMFKFADAKRDKNLNTPEDVTRIDNISYGSDSLWNLLDVYYPKGSSGKNPVIVNVHGGGWIYGTKETYQFYCMSLAQKGFTVVNFNYHLAPKYKFKIQMEDINNVFSWLFSNKEKYYMNTDEIYFIGDSAGAHLTSLYTCICTNKEYAKLYNFKVPNNFIPKAVVLNCGIYDVTELLVSSKMMKSIVIDLLGKNYSNKDIYKIDVLNHITKDFPETFVMSATGDFMKEQLPLLVSKLVELNIPHIWKIYGTVLNKLPHVFQCNIKTKEAILCNEEQASYLLTRHK